MFHNLTDSLLAEIARNRITEVLDAHVEWFCVIKAGTSQALIRNEIEVSLAQGRLILSCWTDRGTRSWKVLAWNWNGETLSLQTSTRLGAERNVIELIPRASASLIAATIRAARQIRCDRVAQLACAINPRTRIERSFLSPGIRKGQPGRFARIVLNQKHQRIAVTASVIPSHAGEIDVFLSSALLWFRRISDRARHPYIQQLWLVVDEHLIQPIQQRLVLFRQSLKEIISVFTTDKDWNALTLAVCPERQQVLMRRVPRFPPLRESEPSALAASIVAQAPGNIDVVHSRHGETLRYLGLPFARIRRVVAGERLWFGTEGLRLQLLDETTADSLSALLDELRTYRSADSPDFHHALYRAASEAWLESLLRRDITKLDPGLVIAPLHAQFRTARSGKLDVRPIDLLALRRDGRLVVIELKVFGDREHVLQGADYWQRVEAHRRRGHLTKARLFGKRTLCEEAPLVYLVTPTLRVHPSFPVLAKCIAPDIEIYRFDINEDWRSGVRVMQRVRVN